MYNKPIIFTFATISLAKTMQEQLIIKLVKADFLIAFAEFLVIDLVIVNNDAMEMQFVGIIKRKEIFHKAHVFS
jgi:hypothetical protein